ncbi:hypothetical protein P186_1936 [Pyrobaculum ferrireducens]|uniref:Uncharacterized protein n=2 Tax=Pyrobaculum ferrireducens TaxID=1104324 RepID=G7VHX8_9CREN|nr:hypothetical protein P186_1936 [Pyrobaculum ferrireducens]
MFIELREGGVAALKNLSRLSMGMFRWLELEGEERRHVVEIL